MPNSQNSNEVHLTSKSLLNSINSNNTESVKSNKQMLQKNISIIKTLITEQNYNKASSLLKTSLKFCHEEINTNIYLLEEYNLFNNMADLYYNRGSLRDYPKAVAIYQYMKVLITQLFDSVTQDKLNQDFQLKIQKIEENIVKLNSNSAVEVDKIKNNLIKINNLKIDLINFRENLKKDLEAIQKLGLREGRLDENGLLLRAEKTELIYNKIQENFIGDKGLFKELITDSIKELGGLPIITRESGDTKEVEHAFFGIGSLSVGTLTPWSDYEGGILIEEGLSIKDLEEVKEFFRRVTVLFQIKLISFGEYPLRMLGITELNDFKGNLNTREEDWFFDNLIKSGLKFDGTNLYACKTPLGREDGYYKTVISNSKEDQVLSLSYELIGTPQEFMKFQTESIWYEEDMNLVQALTNIKFICGSKKLVDNYNNQLSEYVYLIQDRAFEILKHDLQKLAPLSLLSDENTNDGTILDVKKEIYKLPDRTIVALANSFKKLGLSNWEVHTLPINEEGSKNLYLIFAISAELRLRTYSNNNSQLEDLSVIAQYDSNIKELDNAELLKKVFYLKDTLILHRYYYTIIDLASSIANSNSIEELHSMLGKEVFFNDTPLLKSYIYKRFLQYNKAVEELEKYVKEDHVKLALLSSLGKVENFKIIENHIKLTLARLYSNIGRDELALNLYLDLLQKQKDSLREDHPNIAASLANIGNNLQALARYDEALNYGKESLAMMRRLYNSDNADIASSLNNISNILIELGNYEEALIYQEECLAIRKRIYKGDHINIALSLNNMGGIFNLLGQYEASLEYFRQALSIRKKIYKGEHPDIASSLNNIGSALELLGQFEEALKHKEESLAMRKRIYKGDHPDIASSLSNVGNSFGSLGRYVEMLEQYKASLEMQKRIYKLDHPDIAKSLINIGSTLESLGQYEEALKYQQESLDMMKRVYKNDHSNIAISLSSISSTLESLGQYEEALKYQQESLDMMKRIHSNNHPSIAESMGKLGNIFGSLGNFKKALEYNKECLELQKKIYKNDHPDIASSLNNIGNTFELLGQYEEALKYKKESLEIIKIFYKNNHPNLAIAFNNIGNTFAFLGQYEEALKYRMESLNIHKIFYKNNHPNIASSLSNVGITFHALGQYEKALDYQQESLDMMKRIYKYNHPHIAVSLNNIGSLFKTLNQYEKALEYVKLSLDIDRKIYKQNHPKIATSLNNIGNIFRSLGQFDEALQYQRKALEIRKNIYIQDHPDTADSFSDIADTFIQLKKHEKALKYQQEALAIRKRIYEDGHTGIASSLNSIGGIFEALGKYSEALKYFKLSLDIDRKIYKQNHPKIATSLNNIGAVLQSLGQYYDALEYQQEALAIRKKIYQGEHLDIAMSLNNIANIFQSLKHYEEALETQKEALHIQKKIYKKDHPDIAMSLNNIGNTLSEQDKYNEALVYYKKSLEMREKVYEANHPDIAMSLNNIGNRLGDLGEYEEALKYQEKGLAILQVAYKDGHPFIAASLNNIGSTLSNLGRYEEAVQYMKEALSMLINKYHDNPFVIEIINNIINLLKFLSKWEEVLDFSIQARNIINELKLEQLEILKINEKILYIKIGVANQKIIKGEITKAEYAKIAGIELNQLSSKVKQFITNGEAQLAVSCYEVIEKLLEPNNLQIKQTLIFSYQIKTAVEKDLFHKEEFLKYFHKTKAMFEKVLNLNSMKENWYVEYAIFLIKYHNTKNLEEYQTIKTSLNKIIENKSKSFLIYDQSHKLITIKPLQKILNQQNQVKLEPYILAYYLLWIIDNMHGEKQIALNELCRFQSLTKKLKNQDIKQVYQQLLYAEFEELGCDPTRVTYLEKFAQKEIQNEDILSNSIVDNMIFSYGIIGATSIKNCQILLCEE